MNIQLIACLLWLQYPLALTGQKTTTIFQYYEVDGDTITVANKNQIIKEKYTVLKGRKKVKHGPYLCFSKLMDIVEEGNYTNGKKTGVWTRYVENGIVGERFDHDQDSTLEPVVFASRIFKYPPGYLLDWSEKGIRPPQGEVLLEIAFDKNCELTYCEIKTSSIEVFNQIVLKGFMEYTRLRKKYRLSIDECVHQKTYFKVKFDNK